MKLVALLTDFGDIDTYVAEMKAVILSYNPRVVIVDITHKVEAFNTLEGAFLLSLASKTFPGDTIFLAVVDPGVGGPRHAILVKTSSGKIFVGPDTGLLYPAANAEGITKIYRIKSESMGRISNTFHGRDVFARIVGMLAANKSLDEFLEEKDSMVSLDLPSPVWGDDFVKATVLHVDRFGNLILNIKGRLPMDWEKARVFSSDSMMVEAKVVRYYSELAVGDALLTVGGTGYLELAVNRGNAAERFGLRAGDVLTLVRNRS